MDILIPSTQDSSHFLSVTTPDMLVVEFDNGLTANIHSDGSVSVVDSKGNLLQEVVLDGKEQG
jgi:hypothetical protein